jgi:hypothetical protein
VQGRAESGGVVEVSLDDFYASGDPGESGGGGGVASDASNFPPLLLGEEGCYRSALNVLG